MLRLLDCHYGARVGLVVSNGLKIVGATEEGAQLDIKARIILSQPPHFALHAAMPLNDKAAALENQRLRRMQTGEIRGPACLVAA